MTTLNVLFPFSSNSQSFAFTGANGNFTGAYESSGGNPGGCLETNLASSHSNYAYWSLTTTYTALGIPAGATITKISTLTCDVQATMGSGCSWAFGSSSSTNPITAGNFQGMAVEDVTSGTYIWLTQTGAPGAGGESSSFTWATATGDTGPLTGLSSGPSGNVTIWVGNSLTSSGNQIQGFFDNVGFTITYTAPVLIDPAVTEAGAAAETITESIQTPFALRGGTYTVCASAATWGTGSAYLQRLAGDGVTFVKIGTAITANGTASIQVPAGTYRISSTAASTGVVVIVPVFLVK